MREGVYFQELSNLISLVSTFVFDQFCINPNEVLIYEAKELNQK
jgi:hypothetical protein